ncbi:hypothetical protein SLA2020_359580 [Shorea laevis]
MPITIKSISIDVEVLTRLHSISTSSMINWAVFSPLNSSIGTVSSSGQPYPLSLAALSSPLSEAPNVDVSSVVFGMLFCFLL